MDIQCDIIMGRTIQSPLLLTMGQKQIRIPAYIQGVGVTQACNSQRSCRGCPPQGVSWKLGGMRSLVASQLLGEVAIKTSATVGEERRSSSKIFFPHPVPGNFLLSDSSISHLLLFLPTCVWVPLGILRFPMDWSGQASLLLCETCLG